jgi:hypothetical protein
MAVSRYLANKLLDHTLRNVAYTPPTSVHLALFTTMPATDGTGGVEVAGGSYARQAVTFAAADNGMTSNSAAVTFSALPAATLVGVGLFDASSGGNLLHLGQFSTVVSVPAVTDFAVPISDVVAVMR